MKRRALIISAPLTKGKKDYLAGALEDAISWRVYLTSLAGGEWYDGEIVVLINEPKSKVERYINSCKGDYGFVAFSGHGFVSKKDGLTYCKLRSGEFLNERELRFPNVLKQTISIDACREVTEAISMHEDFEKGGKLMSERARRRTETRPYFDEHIGNNVNGVTYLFGAGLNEEAGEDGNGGYYTQSIIEAGNDFSKRSSGDNIIDIYDALLASKTIMRKYTYSQTPMIKVGRRNQYFPFGVRSYYNSSIY